MAEKKDFDEDDSFWNIDTLLPKKRPTSFHKGNVKKGETASVSGEHRETVTLLPEKERKKGTPIPAFSERPERVYRPKGGRITEVEVYSWPNRYAFFEGFRKNALSVFQMEVSEAPFAPYFSFMPQFHQLTAAQLRYYLWWRKNFRQGNCLPADLSYLLLYAYEIINLPEVLPPEEGAELLCRLWISYRKVYPKLEKYLSEWLADYCLIHDVRPQATLFDQVLPFGRKNSSLREFYMNEEDSRQPDLLLSTYNYKESKYRTPENKELYDRHIPAAMEQLLEYLRRQEEKQAALPTKTTVSRTTYDGAVCVYNEKKKLNISYSPVRPLSCVSAITDGVKFCENCLHSLEGVRTRFSTPALTAPMRHILEDYFTKKLSFVPRRREENEERFEEKYEADSKGFSKEEAQRIELQSLEVAKRLGSVFEEEPTAAPGFQTIPSFPDFSASKTISSEEPKKGFGKAEETDRMAFRKEALRTLKEQGQRAFLAFINEKKLLLHSVVEEINEEALERFGDVAIEEREGVFVLLPEYEEEISQWINS